jgi:hypothetical protein
MPNLTFVPAGSACRVAMGPTGVILNRVMRAEPSIGEDQIATPWPVAARNLLSPRESDFYKLLCTSYPQHKVFVQVALSQMIDVPEDRPDRQSIRNRFKQLVADFVLCRADLAVVTVIELDDRTHERLRHQYADARKNKALADAGIRLVRIPAGNLPSAEELRSIIDADSDSSGGTKRENEPRCAPDESDLRLADDWGHVPGDPGEWSATTEDSERAVRMYLLKAAGSAIILVVGWLLYSEVLPWIAQQAFRPLAAIRVAPEPHTTQSVATTSSAIPVASAAVKPPAQIPAENQREQPQTDAETRKQKELAWSTFYSAPASCEHPADWTAQVECGNQYMRAKKAFEERWALEHASAQATGGVVVLENASIGSHHH